ncbi:MAG TPA: phage portal protein, partial [Ktedonobacterales bacterium]|nr:phage portal protein [Ktedonobacterales bacterium]
VGVTEGVTGAVKRARREETPAAQTAESAAIALGGGMFSPGAPMRPTPGISGPGGGPRQWAFPPGYNIAQLPRSTEQTSFAQLRGLAALYDGIQLCERVYFDLLGRLEPRILPRADLLIAGENPAAPRWREPARRIEAFLESPDRAQDLRSWLVAFVRDLLEIDAVAIYTRKSRSGALYALELVAGETIKPLLDGAGRPPLPPAPAYQQFLYGAPAGWYSREELDYLRETARTDSPYGLSRVERIILRVNQALRKQGFDLARFTDGATPLGVIQPPATLTWAPEQLELFERAFNGLLAGNDQMRVRARALPPGATWQALSGDDPLIEFDRFLLNITVAAFGLTMDELGFTDSSNRSVGQTQENVVYRRAVAPAAGLVAGYLTRKVRQWLDDRFTVSFTGFEEPDNFATRAEAFARLIPLGVVSPAEAARLLHLAPSGGERE